MDAIHIITLDGQEVVIQDEGTRLCLGPVREDGQVDVRIRGLDGEPDTVMGVYQSEDHAYEALSCLMSAVGRGEDGYHMITPKAVRRFVEFEYYDARPRKKLEKGEY